MQSGGDHIAEHHSRNGVHLFRQQGKVPVRIVHVEKLRKDSILDVGKFPSGEHSPRVHRESALRLETVPIGGDRGDDHTVPRLKIPNQSPCLHNLPDALVAEDHVMAFPHRALPYGVNVRGAGRDHQRAHKRVEGSALRAVLGNPTCFPDLEHCIAFHKIPPLPPFEPADSRVILPAFLQKYQNGAAKCKRH